MEEQTLDSFRATSSTSDEETIIRYTRDLCQQLGVSELNPQKISWSPLNRVLVLYNSVRLPRRMMDHLTPDEWKPLIASSIIYEGLVADARYKKFNDKKLVLTHFLPQMLVPTLLLVGAIRLSFGVNEFVYKSILLLGSLAGYMSFELPMMRRFLSVDTKDIQFRADMEATETVEKESFLRVLEKIDGMGLDKAPLESLLKISTSARQRIQKLQNH